MSFMTSMIPSTRGQAPRAQRCFSYVPPRQPIYEQGQFLAAQRAHLAPHTSPGNQYARPSQVHELASHALDRYAMVRVSQGSPNNTMNIAASVPPGVYHSQIAQAAFFPREIASPPTQGEQDHMFGLIEDPYTSGYSYYGEIGENINMDTGNYIGTGYNPQIDPRLVDSPPATPVAGGGQFPPIHTVGSMDTQSPPPSSSSATRRREPTDPRQPRAFCDLDGYKRHKNSRGLYECFHDCRKRRYGRNGMKRRGNLLGHLRQYHGQDVPKGG